MAASSCESLSIAFIPPENSSLEELLRSSIRMISLPVNGFSAGSRNTSSIPFLDLYLQNNVLLSTNCCFEFTD